jgi:hypothetical protein
VNIDFYRNETWIDRTFSSKGKTVALLLAVLVSVGVIAAGCGALQNFGNKNTPEDADVPQAVAEAEPQGEVNVPSENTVDLDVVSDDATKMVSYDVTSIGRSDPFMPSGEIKAFNNARSSAIAEANAYNAQIQKIKKMQNVKIRELDDISPYSFNLPVPPTSLASQDSAAAKITRTKVVGIMYNKTNPSAIINVDEKDYLVRQGDKIMGQEYKVMQINPSWITVGLGSNVYSASIGELFSKEDFDKSQNDLYNLRNRFGGRKG